MRDLHHDVPHARGNRRATLGGLLALVLVLISPTPASALPAPRSEPDTSSICKEQAQISESECVGLAQLRSANRRSYQMQRMWFLDDEPCTWAGVGCEGGVVTGLSLTHDRCVNAWCTGVTSIPAAISRLSDLTHLEIDHPAEIKELGPSLASLDRLTHLSVRWAGVKVLSPSIAALPSLESLDLAGNSLTYIPPEFAKSPTIHAFDLSYNNLQVIDPDLAAKPGLTALSFSHNRVKSLPVQEIASATSLQHLGLGSFKGYYHEWSTIFEALVDAGGLRSLDLDSAVCKDPTRDDPDVEINECKQLMPTMMGLTDLEELDLGWSDMFFSNISLPASIENLKQLRSLDLSSTNTASLSEELGSLQHLTAVDLSGNLLRELPSTLGGLSALETLDLGYNAYLTSLPASLGDLANLRSLDLGSTYRLKSLPEELGGLTGLRILYLGDSAVEALPSSIGDLSSLEVLELDRTGLRELPEEIGGLGRLRRLNLFQNRLRSLPDSVSGMSALRLLNLRRNNLRALPAGLSELRGLKMVDASENRIAGDISSWLKPMSLTLTKRRFTLDLSYNGRMNVGGDKRLFRWFDKHRGGMERITVR